MSSKKNKKSIYKWIDDRFPVFSLFRREYMDHPIPKYFNKGWNLIVSFMLLLMIFTGLLLAVHYVPHEEHAFSSVQRIMRDVDYGWLIRYLHMNGASFLFIATYIHMFRGMYYGSFKKPRELVWIFGVMILLLLVMTAFTGYVMSLSQMGGWAATVITGMFSSIPLIGDGLMKIVLGGPSVGTATITRFYVIHMMLPFFILALVASHVFSLRKGLAEKPVNPEHYEDLNIVMYHPYHTLKSLQWLIGFLCIFAVFTFFFPHALSPAEHFIPYDPYVMPERIVPEWYLLPFYGMLRSVTFGINIYILTGAALICISMFPVYSGKEIKIKKAIFLFALGGLFCLIGYAGQLRGGEGSLFLPLPLSDFLFVSAKSLGVLSVAGMFLVLFILPWLDTHDVRSGCFRPVFKWAIWSMVLSVFALGLAGAMPITSLWVVTGQLGMAVYFSWFLIALPLLSRMEPIKK